MTPSLRPPERCCSPSPAKHDPRSCVTPAIFCDESRIDQYSGCVDSVLARYFASNIAVDTDNQHISLVEFKDRALLRAVSDGEGFLCAPAH